MSTDISTVRTSAYRNNEIQQLIVAFLENAVRTFPKKDKNLVNAHAIPAIAGKLFRGTFFNKNIRLEKQAVASRFAINDA